jgi:uncharacterized protein YcaQ
VRSATSGRPIWRRWRRTRRRACGFLAPFDPVVWDRRRFGQVWGWEYRFEAYTPVAKRVLGYYAMPLLWRDRVIGWANCAGPGRDVEIGYVDAVPTGATYAKALDAEIERLRTFLTPV